MKNQHPLTLEKGVGHLSVGIVSADLLNLGRAVKNLEKTQASALHFDVMDGHFTPSQMIGVPLVKAVKTSLLKDVHLMISDPLDKVEAYVNAGADIITMQVESCPDLMPTLKKLGSLKNANHPDRKIIRGAALIPATPVEILAPLLSELELILILGVDPSRAAGPAATYEDLFLRFQSVRQLLRSQGVENMILALDGGVKLENISQLATLGADIVISGSALFKGDGPEKNIPFMLDCMKKRRPREYTSLSEVPSPA